jgi:hypothetical protein
MNNPQIAGTKRVSDWRALRKILLEQPTPQLWDQTCRDFFIERLETRYFEPIRRLQTEDAWTGQGFSIMVILCSVVEFLESTVRGLKYKYRGPCGEYEYDSSREVFMDFLVTRKPFSDVFTDRDIALEFYQAVRCGLMHEAQTKSGWVIWAKSYRKAIIDRAQRKVYRDDFYDAICEVVQNYAKQLINDVELQAAFIRKYDGLCE